MQQSLAFDPELIQKYDRVGPRYTSYPTAVQFHEGFGNADYAEAAARSNHSERALSLYAHIPFCNTACFYCACNKIPTRDRSRSAPYLARLYHEMTMQSRLFDKSRVVDQLHLGGGTPTFISNDEMKQLIDMMRANFNLRDDDEGEYSIEIDPRETDANGVKLLRELGFNRMSLGVQDFDPAVQKAVNRIQSKSETFEVLYAARDNGFKSVNVDLIYGLPLQNESSFMRTVDAILEASPDRVTVFNYAHLPSMFPAQKRMNEADMPSGDMKLRMLSSTIARLQAAGYVYIGMDHFAKPNDELTIAQRAGKLYRNFQGYSTHADCDLIALGATSISMVDNVYAQNLRGLEDYTARIDSDNLAIFRGVALTRDDEIRRAVIMRLMCDFALDFAAFGAAWDIDGMAYFAQEREMLSEFVADGLLTMSGTRIEVQPVGRMMVRVMAVVFDRYNRAQRTGKFSKII
ncbi:MAG: oxygen-independent coproporphyrinogen III oxidase [Thiotrichales bacterium]|jgi:oxygen-independent coproporphyrinogen-3 oxidase|nr:oxygen-independent coproporphyrinogen III oxidase [Thiotrichales bacterium]